LTRIVKNIQGDSCPRSECANKTWSFCSALKIGGAAQQRLRSKYGFTKKSILVGSNSHRKLTIYTVSGKKVNPWTMYNKNVKF